MRNSLDYGVTTQNVLYKKTHTYLLEKAGLGPPDYSPIRRSRKYFHNLDSLKLNSGQSECPDNRNQYVNNRPQTETDDQNKYDLNIEKSNFEESKKLEPTQQVEGYAPKSDPYQLGD